ncbi:hypothetical protein RFI_38548 [Reticulomyxa filosa]|uniref:Uncharacterized protein n=1 Tax=Reticulomyxa filosa TaxID=46433 RepID=X6LCW5_RETFI|nr:hypothetical protein RFI_38548 [Reticulomyxa filosa]|eukprot:ETN98941.1 hypothetical protein RFI_38548 [Reticulomyxa filosa]
MFCLYENRPDAGEEYSCTIYLIWQMLSEKKLNIRNKKKERMSQHKLKQKKKQKFFAALKKEKHLRSNIKQETMILKNMCLFRQKEKKTLIFKLKNRIRAILLLNSMFK